MGTLGARPPARADTTTALVPGAPARVDGARREPLVFAEFPALARAVPWRPLIDGPTPVEPATAIEGWLGRAGVFHKRDDRVASLYGGNKIRRFEFLLADAERRGARTLITIGGLASTQVVATVLLGRASGFEVTASLFDQPVTSFARRALLTSAAAGGRLLRGGGYLRTVARAVAAHRSSAAPYLIFPGASTPSAVLGYVDAMLELGEQVRRGEMPRPDVIVVPAGSGGTLAGLALGAAILRWPTRVVGVRTTESIACNRATIRFLIAATARLLARHAGRRGAEVRAGDARFELHHGAVGGGYGHATPDAIDAIPRMEDLIGTPGEVTYSGKGLVGLRAVAAKYPGETILYWHTLSSAGLDLPAVGPEELPAEFAPVFRGDAPL